ncbi:MAG: SDR family oxidoreductase [Verrucomicrobia bacterium]|nr:SDR family oxidoreductase [Verrucomicrobiota bacterium]
MQHVVITGVSRGLGRAMARDFAANGWTVAGCGTDAAALQSLARELGPDHHVQACDVTDPDAVEEFSRAVTGRFGAPDLLLNNAAIIHPNKPLWEVAADEFSRVIDVNIKGVHLVIRAFLPGMIRRGTGVVVNFSSGWGRSTSPEVATYCATKWGIEGLTGALAQELPAGLAAVALNPGIIDTRMLRSCFGPEAGSYPTPEQWAKVAVPYLASLGPRHNGKALTVPGM